jgi:hypothetical protein
MGSISEVDRERSHLFRREEHQHLNQRIMELESALQGRSLDVPAGGRGSTSSRPIPAVTPMDEPFERWGPAAASSRHSSDGDSDDSQVSPADSNASALRTEVMPLTSASRPRSHPAHHPQRPPRPPQRTTSGNEFNPMESSGTLVLNASGRVRFIGPSAGSQWLREVRQRVVHSGRRVQTDRTRAFGPVRAHTTT